MTAGYPRLRDHQLSFAPDNRRFCTIDSPQDRADPLNTPTEPTPRPSRSRPKRRLGGRRGRRRDFCSGSEYRPVTVGLHDPSDKGLKLGR